MKSPKSNTVLINFKDSQEQEALSEARAEALGINKSEFTRLSRSLGGAILSRRPDLLLYREKYESLAEYISNKLVIRPATFSLDGEWDGEDL